MYDRAPRNLSEPFGSTQETVGPGTYDNEVQAKAKIRAGQWLKLTLINYVTVICLFVRIIEILLNSRSGWFWILNDLFKIQLNHWCNDVLGTF